MDDECLKHSYYTRVGLSFLRLFDSNFIVFVARPLIWCLVWIQVHWSEKSSCWKQFLEQWGSEQGSDCHVAMSQRRDIPTPQRHDVGLTMQKSTSGNVATSQRRNVPTSRCQLEICTLSFKVRMAQKSGYREAYERRHGIPEQSDTDFEEVPGICTVFHCLDILGY